MKTFIFPRLSLIVICAFLFQMSVGFSGFRWDGESHNVKVSALTGQQTDPRDLREVFFGRSHNGFTGIREANALDTASFQDLLVQYNTYADLVVEQIVLFYDNAYYLDQALKTGDDLVADMLIDEQDALADSLLETVDAWNEVERQIQVAMGTPGAKMIRTDRAGPRFFPAIVGAGLLIWGIYEYGKELKDQSNKVSAGRDKRDKAEFGSEEYKQGKNEMNQAGEKVIKTMVTKATTELITAPIEAETAIGKIILEKGLKEKVIEPGITMITSTKDCANSGGSSPGCKIGVGKTDSEGKVNVPSGDVVVSVSGGDKARDVVEATVVENGTTTVTHEPVTIAEATPETVSQAGTETETVVQTETGETVEPTTEGENTGGDTTVGTDEPVGEGTDGGTSVGTGETGNISDFLLGPWSATLVIPGDGQPGSCLENGINTGGSVYIHEGGSVTASFGDDPTSGTWSYDGSTLTLNFEGNVFSGSAPPNTAHITLSGPQGATMSLST